MELQRGIMLEHHPWKGRPPVPAASQGAPCHPWAGDTDTPGSAGSAQWDVVTVCALKMWKSKNLQLYYQKIFIDTSNRK